jgi:tetratricopeptide (TPR) repeat protein
LRDFGGEIMTQPALSPASVSQPATKRASARERAPAPEWSETGRREENAGIEEQPPVGGPPGPSAPDAPSSDGQLPAELSAYLVRELGRTSRETRRFSLGSWFALLALTVIAISSVALGIAAKSATFWAYAGACYYAALAVVIALAAKKLGIVSGKTKDLQDKVNESTLQSADTQSGAAAVAKAALDLAGTFEEEGQLPKAEFAYEVAARQNNSPEALFWLGQRCVAQGQYAEGELWLLKAVSSGDLAAAYLLGCLHRIHGQSVSNDTYNEMFKYQVAAYVVGRNETQPDGEAVAQLAIAPARVNTEIFKNLANALPDHVEFWQAYFESLLKNDGIKTARVAIDKAIEDHQNSSDFRLLRIRLDSSDFRPVLIYSFPEQMHPELHFHLAVKLIRKYDGGREKGLSEAISAARGDQADPRWQSQLLAIEAIHEYGSERDLEAGDLLTSALTSKPKIAPPLSSEDVQLLALILKSSGDKTTSSLRSELIDARSNLKNALSSNIEDRKPVLKALISSMVHGIDIAARVPGSPALDVARVSQSVGSTSGLGNGEDDIP